MARCDGAVCCSLLLSFDCRSCNKAEEKLSNVELGLGTFFFFLFVFSLCTSFFCCNGRFFFCFVGGFLTFVVTGFTMGRTQSTKEVGERTTTLLPNCREKCHPSGSERKCVGALEAPTLLSHTNCLSLESWMLVLVSLFIDTHIGLPLSSISALLYFHLMSCVTRAPSLTCTSL
jgi:hypothetical protein